MDIETIKNTILKKIEQEINYMTPHSSYDSDEKLSVVLKNLTEAYKNLSDIKEEK